MSSGNVISVQHSFEEGTTCHGTSRGDGTAAILKGNGWRWGRHLKAWYLPRSRDLAPKRSTIDATVQALRDAGFTVEAVVNAAVGDAGQAEARKIAREQARAEVLRQRAQAAQQRSEAHHGVADQISAGIPFGQPILVGHHSQRRHERDLHRIHSHTSAGVAEAEKARDAQRRADIADAAAAARRNPVTLGNRIAALSADVRRFERLAESLADEAGLRVAEQLAHTRSQLAYWQQVRAELIASGDIAAYGPDSGINPGDQVLIRRRWRTVVKVNAKSLTLKTDYSWTDRVPYHAVTGHRRGDESNT